MTQQDAVRAVHLMRGELKSPGRPSNLTREQRTLFWEAIAEGVSTDDASARANVSEAVGARWFRQGGGMPPSRFPELSGRYLSFSEREEIAVLNARGDTTDETLTLDNFKRVAAQRSHPLTAVGVSGLDGTLACATPSGAAEGFQTRRQPNTARVCPGTTQRHRDR